MGSVDGLLATSVLRALVFRLSFTVKFGNVPHFGTLAFTNKTSGYEPNAEMPNDALLTIV